MLYASCSLNEHRLRESVSLIPLKKFSRSTRKEHAGICLFMLVLLVMFEFIGTTSARNGGTYPSRLERFHRYLTLPNPITQLHTRPPDIFDVDDLIGRRLGPVLSLDYYQKRLRGKTLQPSAYYSQGDLPVKYASTKLYPCWPRSVASGCQNIS